MEGRPFSPAEVVAARSRIVIPAIVFDAVNELLVSTAPDANNARTITKDAIASLVQQKLTVLSRQTGGSSLGVQCYDEWLRFEDLYAKRGWGVGVDSTGPIRFCFIPI